MKQNYEKLPDVSCEVIPLLGEGGVAAPVIKCREASLAAQTGWFVQLPNDRWLNEPPRPLR
jgi:hypothetical protein